MVQLQKNFFSSWSVGSLRRSLLCLHYPVSKMIIRINSNLPSVFKDTRKGIQIHRLNHYAKLERNNDLNLKMDVGENFSFLLDKPTLFYVNFYNKFWLSDY